MSLIVNFQVAVNAVSTRVLKGKKSRIIFIRSVCSSVGINRCSQTCNYMYYASDTVSF